MKRCKVSAVACLIVFLVCLIHPELSNVKRNLPMTENYETTQTLDIHIEEIKKEEPKPPHVSAIDFKAWKDKNPDIYAWLEIPGTKISYPVVQHMTDDSFYLNSGIDGQYAEDGTLFTEKQYNKTDFSDPVTVIYGHNMNDGDMFGDLQEDYSKKVYFIDNGKIIVYLPDGELHYVIFAAVPFDNWHILYNCNFSNRRTFEAFFKEILSTREIGANFNDHVTVNPGDRVLILSTCLKGNRDRRYLVCARLLSS